MRFLRCIVVAGLLVGSGLQPLWATGRDPAYLTSASCAECHPDAYSAWSDSHHGWAWRSAKPENVLGDFAQTTFEHRGVRSRFSSRDGRYFVETDGPDGRPATYEITWTVGVSPLQQYLVELDDGRLQALDVAWDTERGRWYQLYPEQVQKNDPGLHWTGPYKNWNTRCVSCHVTGFVKGYEPQTDRYQSSWSETGVGCEACHGPGEAHVAWAKRPEQFSLKVFEGVDAKGLAVSFETDAPVSEIEVCAGCHSRRESLDADSAPPGEPFADHYRLALLREGLYHADGQIQDEVYVYGSFLQSKMHARGVRCGHCHEPHGAKLVAGIDAVCTECHRPEDREDFPTLLPASYVSSVHHHHRPGSEEARCVSCHMPARTYMGVDSRHDHSFRVPRPDLTVKLGVPNACNGCHTDRSAEWAQERVEAWFPKGRHLQPHYGEILHAGRQSLDQASVAGLIDLALDRAQPAIARASAVELLTPVASPPIVGQALPLLDDPSPLVRSAVLGLFHAAPSAARAKHSGPLLDDPVRSVRIAAAQRILDIPTDNLSRADQAIVKGAVGEYQASLSAHADFPEVQLNLSRFAEQVDNRKAARQALQAAIALDPKLAEAWLRLARLEVDAGRFVNARQTLERAVSRVPDSGTLYQLLGRVLVQLDDEAAAVHAFEKALHGLPGELDVRIEYVSLLTNLGKHTEALEVLVQTDEAARINPSVLYLLAFNHVQMNEMEKARHFARELSNHHPEHSLNQYIQSVLTKNKN
jgi:tetratricopeptide (TPR) repeat protein